MSFLKYLIYNCSITGILIAGYFLKVSAFAATIVGAYYGFVVTILFIGVIFSSNKDFQKKLKSSLNKSYFWKIPFEVLFIAITIYFGYPKIAICMIFELFSILYLFLICRQNEEIKDNES